MCRDVHIKPTMQKLTGEQFEQRAGNRSDEAGLSGAARGFWAAGQIAFFDITAFYSNATRYADQILYVMLRMKMRRRESTTTE